MGRNRIGECFELAGLPGTSEEDRKRLLSFVVVGGGPTGVEFAGTLSDFLRNDLKKKYPRGCWSICMCCGAPCCGVSC